MDRPQASQERLISSMIADGLFLLSGDGTSWLALWNENDPSASDALEMYIRPGQM